LSYKKPDAAHGVIVALGSNLSGHYPTCQTLLEAALSRFGETGLRVARRSRWWRSAAWPETAHPDYLNGVALVETKLGPAATLDALLMIEKAFGRERGVANAPRTLDLDLIAHGRTILDSAKLTLPHPRAHNRRFVMGPLAEIAPGWVHPVLGQTAANLARAATIGLDAEPAP
jgi:2-amino-4-hydroxy-6-hydroxymethyldihydropteridine diphosphokinase